MNLAWLNDSEQLLFGQQLSSVVKKLLQRAAATSSFNSTKGEELLWETQQMHPQQLVIYLVIYKFYLYQARLPEAYQTLRQGMLAAAEAGDFPADWNTLTASTTNWQSANLPQRLYLYYLKELGVMLQRMGNGREYYRVLEKSYELDPDDNLTATGIRMLASERMKPE